MKKTFSIIFGIFIGLFVSSCSSDDSSYPDPNTNFGFTLNGVEYATRKGYLTHQSNDGTGYKNLIILTNGEVLSDPFDADTLNANEFSSNTSNIIVFTINSTSTNELADGTYHLDNTNHDGSGNLYWTTIITGITIQNNLLESYNYESFTSNNSSNPIVSGSLTIIKNQNNYEITYTLNQNNTVINGSFSGLLTELEYSE